MALTVSAPQINGWQLELESIGRVVIKSNFSSLSWRVGIAFLLAAGMIYVRYLTGDLGQQGLSYAIGGLALLFFVLVAGVRMYWGGKSIIVERDSIVTMDRARIPWTDIIEVSVFEFHRSGPAVQLILTEDGWNAYISGQGRNGKLIHRANSTITRNRGIVMSQYLDGQPHELAAWLNQFVRGKDSESS